MERRVSDPRRPSNLWHSQGIHPEGSVSTLSGETRRAVPEERRLARAKARVTLHDKRLSPARHARGSKTDQRKRFVFDDVETFAGSPHGRLTKECGTMPLGMCGRTACPWTSSNARSIENRAWRLPAKELRLPSASSDGDPRVVATASSGSRRLKARGRGDLRLETGIIELLPGVR